MNGLVGCVERARARREAKLAHKLFAESRAPDSLLAGFCLLPKVEANRSLEAPASISTIPFLPGQDVGLSQCYLYPTILFRPYPFIHFSGEKDNRARNFYGVNGMTGSGL